MRLAVLAALAISLAPAAVYAGTGVRYALVVGNNSGRSSGGTLDDLLHAEREATLLRDSLVHLGNFDADRVILLRGAGRSAILDAAHRLAERRRRDRAELGAVPTLFALFFTGHGLSGKLLTADEPLSGGDLATIFGQMDAELTFGFFDACYAGSFDLEALKAKGARATPGFNPIAELPEEVLNSEGTLWFVSSRPGELSYEDERLGGLFTHFFIESFKAAIPDGIGIPLDAMWEYARRRTQAHVARYGRSQTPEKIVRHLKAQGPLYFSFPRQRSARLLFERDLEGTFLVRYAQDALVERIQKQKGQAVEVPVYEGQVVISRLQGPSAEPYPSREFAMARGAVVRVASATSPGATFGLGYREASIRSKGELAEVRLAARHPALSVGVGAGYRYGWLGSHLLGAPHAVEVTAFGAFGGLSLGADLSYGPQSESFATWSYQLHEVGLRLSAGYGFELAGLRLTLEATGGVLFDSVAYASGATRHPVGGAVGAALRLLLPIPRARPAVVLQLRAGVEARFAEGVAVTDARTYAAASPVVELGLTFPLRRLR